ncbi:DUF1614 domain-containing protein [Hydrogenibacillus schlegelii]|uniref:DUF1614 domain-containing protein n=1 Tax=Hydrogenibacillus schlegelii TaxID=1484 RepID=A0A132MFY9_HYDSH|nr:DUF1614 domain-containing protein [Hydrogenibacillus schlegelii]KWW96754.1 hypothetical protein TR75_12290 [Hydrogenibacillus schlegelii]MBT9283025.1 DUF1614 domain-containing protein [Hydrogenibacillus schlegelii]OAR05397.1 hypothetical protein SA87_10875 [Hydrogenibacillus schlegelii]PTQ54399.1 MAG: hypothetical protein HSCHL_0318 [Hydrogenibacillus schlegelii]
MPIFAFFLLLLLLPFLAVTLFFQVTAFSFTKLGLTPIGATTLLTLSVVGSMINLPVSRRRTVVYRPEAPPFFSRYFFYYPPQVDEQIIAVNVGGAVIPLLFSLYLLLTRAPLLPTLIGAAVVTAVAKALARPVPGVGIALPAFIPPLVAAAVALLIDRNHAAAIAYVSGVLGTLIGADLLNLHRLRDIGGHILSIGGAGVFDGIFLTSIIAAFLA